MSQSTSLEKVVTGTVETKGVSGVPATIDQVHGYDPVREIIPIRWANAPNGLQTNPDLAIASDAILERLARKYGARPGNAPEHGGRMDNYEAKLDDGVHRRSLGRAEVYIWDHCPREGVEPKIPAVVQHERGASMTNLQIIIFQHPEQEGTYLYQVTAGHDAKLKPANVPIKELFDAGFYHVQTQTMAEARIASPTQKSLPK